MFKYSVIIPYRDTYNLLLKAISSIPERVDIQILVVDNSEIPLTGDRIPVRVSSTLVFLTSSPEKGAGCARNVGLNAAEGEFVLFLDADDYFTEKAFVYFDKYADACNDITYFKATSLKLDTGMSSTRHFNISQQIDAYLQSGNEDWVRFRIENPICKLFLKRFLDSRNFRFEEVNCSNDTMFSMTTGYYAKTIMVSSNVVYVITEGVIGTTLTSKKSKENQFIRFVVSIRRNKFLSDVGKKKYRMRLLPSICFAFKHYGFFEGWRYISYAIKSRTNIFTGYFGI